MHLRLDVCVFQLPVQQHNIRPSFHLFFLLILPQVLRSSGVQQAHLAACSVQQNLAANSEAFAMP